MHFTLVAVLPPTATSDIDAAVSTALAPYDLEREVEAHRVYQTATPRDAAWVRACRRRGELPDRDDLSWAQVAETINHVRGHAPGSDNYLHVDDQGRAYFLSTHNPNGKWDGYRIGGQWSPHFIHHPHATGDPRLIIVRYGDTDENTALTCDGGPRALLDFDAMRQHQARQASERHARWTALVAALPEAQPWDHFLARHAADPGRYAIEQARQDYQAQARCQAALSSEEFRHWPGEFSMSREQYVAQARDHAVPGDALLRLDGTWQEPTTEDSRAAYTRTANNYLNDLADDILLVALHCHR